jgi:hypothetical protein
MPTALKKVPDESLSLDDFIPLSAFVTDHPQIWPAMSGARWAINNADKNGLNEYGCLIKRAGKVFVVKPRMAQWLAAGSDWKK